MLFNETHVCPGKSHTPWKKSFCFLILPSGQSRRGRGHGRSDFLPSAAAMCGLVNYLSGVRRREWCGFGVGSSSARFNPSWLQKNPFRDAVS